MKYFVTSIALITSSAAAATAGAADKIQVVATLSDLAKIAEELGGDRATVTSIASGIQDPHFVDPKPSYVVKLRDADLVLVNGLQLEIGWVPPLLDGARNPKINAGAAGYVDCSKNIPVIEVPGGEVTRAQGDVHPLGNPHYLLDPLNGKIVAETIAAALSRAAPDGAAYFEGRKKAFQKKIDEAMFGAALVDEVGGNKLDRLARSGELDAFLQKSDLTAKLGGWMAKMRPFVGRKIVFYHKSYSYFAQRFGITVANYVELKPGIQPGPGHLADVITELRRDKIAIVGTHAFYDEKIAALVAEKGGAKLLVLPLGAGGDPAATDYLKLFDVVVSRFAGAFGKSS